MSGREHAPEVQKMSRQVPDAQPFKCTCGAGKTGLPCTCHEEYQPLQDSLLPPSEQQINAAAPPQHANGSDEFSTGLCECVQGPQSCYICMSSWLLPCFSYAHVRDHAAGSGTKHPCSMFCVLTTLPQFIPYVGGIVTTVSRTVLGMQGRQLLRQKYGLKEDDCGDCCAHCCCQPCAFAQELRHIRDNTGALTMPDLV